MKNFRFILLFTLIFSFNILLTACGGTKTAETVFPTSTACSQNTNQSTNENYIDQNENKLIVRDDQRFIVQWENGTYTIETARSSEEFRAGFVNKNLALIKHVDNDYRIKLTNQEKLANVMAENPVQIESLNWAAQQIAAPQLWNQGIEGAGVVIGVVDGMVDTNHSQIASNIQINPNEIPNNKIDDDKNGWIDDDRGIQVNAGTNDSFANRHGTHVTGIIVADQSQGPISGIAQKAKVLPAQFIGNDGGGSIGDAIIALNYVANRGVKIINMSWGLDACVVVPNLQSTLQQLNDRGILLVTAAGNGNSRGMGINMDINPAYPSAYNFLNQINVAASTSSNFLIGFSNYGRKAVHVAAPGVGIYSTVPNNEVETMSGTSMAAPVVSGAAALLWSAVPTASAQQIKKALIQSVDRNPSALLEISSGGVINVDSAFSLLKTLITP